MVSAAITYRVVRTLAILPLLMLSAFAREPLLPQSLNARYKISYAFFSDIAETTLHFRRNHGRYRIEAKASLKGFAAALAHHHREFHTSEGIVTDDGRLLPRRYTVVRTLDDFRREQVYTFDYTRKSIRLTQTVDRNITERRFNSERLSFETSVTHKHEIRYYRMNFFAEDDLLTLYFNVRKLLESPTVPVKRRLGAVGSRSGIVILETLPPRSVTPLPDSPLNTMICRVFIDQDIFRSKKGELYIGLDRSLLVNEAVLKDVFLFGDLHVERMADTE